MMILTVILVKLCLVSCINRIAFYCLPISEPSRLSSSVGMDVSQLTYSRDQLLSIHELQSERQWLDPEVFHYIRELGLSNTNPVRRGKRSGCRKQRSIKIQSGLCSDNPLKECKSHCNVENLIFVSPKTNTHGIKVGLWNAQSAKNKTCEISDYILDFGIDILFLTETWLSVKGDEAKCHEMTPPGYKLHHVPRLNGRGGGLACVYRQDLHVGFAKLSGDFSTFEHMSIVIASGKRTIKAVCIYRPPPSRTTKLSSAVFSSEFATLCSSLDVKQGSCFILGDFNVHYNSTDNPLTKQILKTLESHDLKQYVVEATHRLGHVIDWVVGREDGLISALQVEDSQMSDHFMVTFNLNFDRPVPEKKTVQVRNIKKIDIQKFNEDLLESTLFTDSTQNVDELTDMFNTTLSELLDKHAPVKLKQVRPQDASPWYNSVVLSAKRERRIAERHWRKSHLEIHRQIYNHARNSVNKCIRKARSDYFNTEISANAGNLKRLFCTLNKLLGKSSDVVLPKGEDATVANDFQHYFSEKIAKLRHKFVTACDDVSYQEFQGEHLSSFTNISEQEIKNIITSSKPTSCEEDPISTKFMLKILDTILPVITRIVNLSLSSGTVPRCFKRAVIKPLLKKPSLEPENLSNYRPVSNLSFISKILEKVVKSQMLSHLQTFDLIDKYQSAYRSAHSTETALNAVLDNIKMSVDNGDIAMLVLLDLSSAFDTIDHATLLSRLQTEYGIDITVLKWFSSYLENRSQSVQINRTLSDVHILECGVPQGSVLGPILYTMYTKPLGQLIIKHFIGRHFYADDSQLMDSFKPCKDSQQKAKVKMESCLNDVKSWMTSNKLVLNDSKTEAIIIAPRQRRQKCQLTSISIGQSSIPFSTSVRNLGVYLDSNLSMKSHISHICKTCYYHLRNIGSIRNILTMEATATLVRTLVLTRLDYCNSLLFGISEEQLQRLQKIQNQAARIVTRTKLCSHITPALNSLHWLRIRERIEFKVLSLVYQTISNLGPAYLQDLLHLYKPERSLRSSDKLLLVVPKYKLKTFGANSFSYAAATLWNSLPQDLRASPSLPAFKSRLKTHLFQRYI